jgi:uncharacterized protein (TIGR03083 family)
MSDVQPVNSMSYAGKETVLGVVRRERQAFYDLIDNPANWNVQTRCTEWQTRDIVGHMIDVTEGYLSRWEMARKSEPAEALGTVVMGEKLNEHAQKFRSLTRDEAITRLKAASEKMMAIFDALTEDEWNNFIVTHPYMGPLPTFFYPAFHVMDYGVHTWDIRYGLGEKTRKLDEATAGVLIPYMLFALWPNTVDAASAKGVDVQYGIDISSGWGGKWSASMKDGKFEAKPEAGDFAGCDAIFGFDPSDFVLTAFQRFEGGAARGDPAAIKKARGLFFTI